MSPERVRGKVEGQKWECGVSVQCTRVKEEPGLEREHDSSSACARAAEEPEWTQDRDSSEASPRAEEGDGECGVSAAAARAGLYAGHEVKSELVLGPEWLQPPDSVFAPTVAPKNTEYIANRTSKTECPEGSCTSPRSSKNQLQLRPCFVSLECLPVHKVKQANNVIPSTCLKRQNVHEIRIKGPLEACATSELLYSYSCNTCGKLFSQKRSLVQHIQLHCSDSDHSKILTWDKPMHVKKQLTRFSSMHAPSKVLIKQCADIMGKKPNKSEIRKKQSLHNEKLVKLELMHTEKQSHKCEICMKQFSHKGNLVRHRRIHMGDKPFECDFCLKRFSRCFHLVQHKRIHTNEKPFQCDTCLKEFSHKHNFLQHVRIHTGEKPFKCDICMKHFSQKRNLDQHKQMHTGEKPYKCGICMKQFTYKCNLVAHQRVHTGEKLYKCEICMKQFSQRSHLVGHEQIHTGEKTQM